MTFNGYPQTDSMAPYSDAQPRTAPQLQTWRRGYMDNAKLASWPLRLAAGAIDYLPLILIIDLLGQAHAAALGFVIAAAAILANNVYMQGITGQSLGKRIVGIRLVTAVEDGPASFRFVLPGVGRCLTRQLAHFLDSLVFYLGYFRPIWHRRRQTWADSIASTAVLDRSAAGLVIERRAPGASTMAGI
jgi:uncharacterized RDD family membrane protein YckC